MAHNACNTKEKESDDNNQLASPPWLHSMAQLEALKTHSHTYNAFGMKLIFHLFFQRAPLKRAHAISPRPLNITFPPAPRRDAWRVLFLSFRFRSIQFCTRRRCCCFIYARVYIHTCICPATCSSSAPDAVFNIKIGIPQQALKKQICSHNTKKKSIKL